MPGIMHWTEFGLPPEHMDWLREVAKRYRSNPDDWYGVFAPIPSSFWLSVEDYTFGSWGGEPGHLTSDLDSCSYENDHQKRRERYLAIMARRRSRNASKVDDRQLRLFER